ncbi:MAG: hypothetical protein ACXVCP_15185 [Bdellovibrio sp.]
MKMHLVFVFFLLFSIHSLADLDIEMPSEKTPTNAKEFLHQFRRNELFATGSGNGGNPTSLRFSNLAHTAIHVCRIDQHLEQMDPEKSKVFKENLSHIRVRMVDFNLCKDDSVKCPFETSLAAKSFSDLHLILINQAKIMEMNLEEQTMQSVKSFLEVLQIPEDKGITSQVHLQTRFAQTENGYQLIQHCSF